MEFSSGESSVNLRKTNKKLTKRQKSLNSKKRQKNEYTKCWSESEKQDLLRLLYEHGDTNLELIASNLPHKHITQVKTYLRTIARRAFLANNERCKTIESLQLEEWIKFLKRQHGEQPLDESLPFQLYCLPKENPKMDNTIVNFKKAYEYLYSLACGRKISIDDATHYFVHSYIEYFLKQFVKHLIPNEPALLTSAITREITVNNMNPLEIFCMLNKENIKNEQFLNKKHILKSICRSNKRSNFKRGEEYDQRVSLLKAEIDEEITVGNNLALDPSSSCIIVPYCKELEFRNLPSFIWSSLFKLSIKDMKEAEEDDEQSDT